MKHKYVTLLQKVVNEFSKDQEELHVIIDKVISGLNLNKAGKSLITESLVKDVRRVMSKIDEPTESAELNLFCNLLKIAGFIVLALSDTKVRFFHFVDPSQPKKIMYIESSFGEGFSISSTYKPGKHGTGVKAYEGDIPSINIIYEIIELQGLFPGEQYKNYHEFIEKEILAYKVY